MQVEEQISFRQDDRVGHVVDRSLGRVRVLNLRKHRVAHWLAFQPNHVDVFAIQDCLLDCQIFCQMLQVKDITFEHEDTSTNTGDNFTGHGQNVRERLKDSSNV